MSSAVEICNLALAHLGDSATVASIDPPEGSAQAEHCATWYPIARDNLLELHDWAFASVRVALAQLDNPFTQWQYAYARPSDAVRIIDVLAADATADYSAGNPDFVTESDSNGNQLILTNQPDALARYTRIVTDTSKFSPLFRDTLGWYLASYLAGPVLKAETGINVGRASMQTAMGLLAAAKLSAAQQQRIVVPHSVPWLAVR